MRTPTTPGDVLQQAMLCAGATLFLAVVFVMLGEGKSATLARLFVLAESLWLPGFVSANDIRRGPDR